MRPSSHPFHDPRRLVMDIDPVTKSPQAIDEIARGTKPSEFPDGAIALVGIGTTKKSMDASTTAQEESGSLQSTGVGAHVPEPANLTGSSSHRRRG